MSELLNSARRGVAFGIGAVLGFFIGFLAGVFVLVQFTQPEDDPRLERRPD